MVKGSGSVGMWSTCKVVHHVHAVGALVHQAEQARSLNARLRGRGARGEGLRGGFVSLLVPKGALIRHCVTCAVSSKPCFRFAQTACSLPPFAAVTGCGLSYTWLRHVPANPRLPIRRFASHGLAHPARHTPAPARAGKAPGETPAGAFRRMPKG